MNTSSLQALLRQGSAQERVSLLQLRQEYDDSRIVHHQVTSSSGIIKNDKVIDETTNLQLMSSSKRKFDDFNNTSHNDQDSSAQSSKWDNISGHNHDRSLTTTESNHRTNDEDVYNGNCSNDLDVHIGKQIVSSSSQRNRSCSFKEEGSSTSRDNLNNMMMKQQQQQHRINSCCNSSKPIESRTEKNQREKIRSSRIANQIKEIHELLFHAGIKCPRGTKGMILSEAAEYIRTLQITHYNNNQQQIQLQQQLNEKQQQQQSSYSSSLQQYKLNLTPQQYHANNTTFDSDILCPDHTTITNSNSSSSLICSPVIVINDFYKEVFHSCNVGIAICTMGGSILDCNESFSLWSGYTKENIISKTLFDFINRNDLHRSFNIISQLVLSSLVSMKVEHEQDEQTKKNTESSIEEVEEKQLSSSSVIVRGLQQQRSNHQDQQDWNIRVTLVTSSSTNNNNDKISKIPKYLTISLVSDNINSID